MIDFPERYTDPGTHSRIALIAQSHLRLTGRMLVPAGSDPVRALWDASPVVIAHGTEDDPLFFYANRAALGRFDMALDTFIGMPSRYSAEAPLREERQALLDAVARQGFIDDYAGVRIAASGRRFRIEAATVWNLIDTAGTVHGQAAAFSQWTELN